VSRRLSRIRRPIKGYADEAAFVGDFNGDGADDIMSIGDGAAPYNVALSNRSSFASAVGWPAQGCYATGLHHAVIGDINGDRKADVLCIGTDGSSGNVILSTGSSFNYAAMLNQTVPWRNKDVFLGRMLGGLAIVRFDRCSSADVFVYTRATATTWNPPVKWNDWFAPGPACP
jgi:hypothetical protein